MLGPHCTKQCTVCQRTFALHGTVYYLLADFCIARNSVPYLTADFCIARNCVLSASGLLHCMEQCRPMFTVALHCWSERFLILYMMFQLNVGLGDYNDDFYAYVK